MGYAILGLSGLLFVWAVWNYHLYKKVTGFDIPLDYTDQWDRFRRAYEKTPVRQSVGNVHFDLARTVSMGWYELD